MASPWSPRATPQRSARGTPQRSAWFPYPEGLTGKHRKTMMITKIITNISGWSDIKFCDVLCFHVCARILCVMCNICAAWVWDVQFVLLFPSTSGGGNDSRRALQMVGTDIERPRESKDRACWEVDWQMPLDLARLFGKLNSEQVRKMNIATHQTTRNGPSPSSVSQNSFQVV